MPNITKEGDNNTTDNSRSNGNSNSNSNCNTSSPSASPKRNSQHRSDHNASISYLHDKLVQLSITIQDSLTTLLQEVSLLRQQVDFQNVKLEKIMSLLMEVVEERREETAQKVHVANEERHFPGPTPGFTPKTILGSIHERIRGHIHGPLPVSTMGQDTGHEFSQNSILTTVAPKPPPPAAATTTPAPDDTQMVRTLHNGVNVRNVEHNGEMEAPVTPGVGIHLNIHKHRHHTQPQFLTSQPRSLLQLQNNSSSVLNNNIEMNPRIQHADAINGSHILKASKRNGDEGNFHSNVFHKNHSRGIASAANGTTLQDRLLENNRHKRPKIVAGVKAGMHTGDDAAVEVEMDTELGAGMKDQEISDDSVSSHQVAHSHDESCRNENMGVKKGATVDRKIKIEFLHIPSTVQEIYDEFYKGYNGQEPLCELDNKYGKLNWRGDSKTKDSKRYQRRKRLCDTIKKYAKSLGKTDLEVIAILEEFRMEKSLTWIMNGHLPPQLESNSLQAPSSY